MKVCMSGDSRNSVIFVHIPKTAGQSIAKRVLGSIKPGHYFWNVYYAENKRYYENAFKFCFVRDPLERLESAYYYLMNGGGSKSDKRFYARVLCKYPTFESFVEDWLNEKNVMTWIHFIPQHFYIFNESNECMVDFVGRFERIEEDFAYISERLNLDKQLEVVNKNTKKSKSELSQGLISKIRKIYKRDYELLGY